MRTVSSNNNVVYFTIARDHPEVLSRGTYHAEFRNIDTDRLVETTLIDLSEHKPSYQKFILPLGNLRPLGTWYIKIHHLDGDVQNLVHTGMLKVEG